MAEILYVQLPQGKGRVSVSFAINLGAILVLPPHEAAVVAAGGVFVANLVQRMAIDIILFNVAQLWITALATAHHGGSVAGRVAFADRPVGSAGDAAPPSGLRAPLLRDERLDGQREHLARLWDSPA